MKSNRTALGVSPGLEQASFVFGGLSKATGVAFNLADNLHRAESIAQQQLDFIQKLYFEQSFLGEYFEEIHLGGLPETGSPDSLASEQRLQVHLVLVERLNEWIAIDQLNLVLSQHTGISIRAQAKYLSVNSAIPDLLAGDTTGMTDAFAVWSFIFSEATDVSKRRVFKKYQPIEYAEMSRGIADHYLDRYKNDTIASFSETKFREPDIEKARLQLLGLANISQSGKHEMLVCREKILQLLEIQSLEKARMPESSITGNRRHVELTESASVSATVAAVPEQAKSAASAPAQVDTPNTTGDSNDFFTSPQFSVSDNLPAAETSGKTWREPNARIKMRTDAWVFRTVVILVLVGLYFLARRM